MNEYINLTLENIDEEHICCAIGDKKHQAGVDSKKKWIKSKLKDGHIFRKLNARGKIFIEYEPIETAWIPISGKNYEYIYCLWVAGSFKGKGIGKELIEYAINDSKEKGKSGICTLVSKKKKPFIGEKKFFEHYGFKVVDSIADYELLALQLVCVLVSIVLLILFSCISKNRESLIRNVIFVTIISILALMIQCGFKNMTEEMCIK